MGNLFIQNKPQKNGKKSRRKNQDPNSANNVILDNFLNYMPPLEGIALSCASEKIKKKITPIKPEYKAQICLPPEDLSVLPFEDKVEIFKNAIHQLKVDWRKGSDYININRENIIDMSIDQFKLINLYKELKINFIGEVNQDAGGLIREWFTVLFKELQSEKINLFEKADTQNYSLKISQSIEKTDQKCFEVFNFIGKLIAKALLDNLTVNTCFNLYIYKLILDEPITFEDLIEIDEKLYHSLQSLKSNNNIGDLELYFSTEFKNKKGRVVSDNLIVNGDNIKVTNENFEFYKKCRINYICKKDIDLIHEIKKGLFAIIPQCLLAIFSASQFELLLNGTPFIDVDDWKANTVYEGYYTTDSVIVNFWDIMKDLSQDELSRILQFCTGSNRVPIGGFKSLESNRGNKSPFCINRGFLSRKEKNFIKAHTCFNRLDIPPFDTKEELKEAINFIIFNEITGFGID